MLAFLNQVRKPTLCSHKEAAGAATGFVGLFAYLGASLAGWPLAKVLDTWHWSPAYKWQTGSA